MNSARFLTLCLATVSAFAAPPIPVADTYNASEDTPLVIPAAAGVLFNDNPNGHPQIEAGLATPTANGTLTLNADGSFTYTPNANFSGTDSFTYRARNFLAPVTFDIDPAQSTSVLTARVRGPLGIDETDSDDSRLDGTVTAGVLEPKTTGPFSLIQVTGLNAVLIDPLDMYFDFGFFIGDASMTALPNAITVSMDVAGAAAPVNGAGQFTQTGNTLAADGIVHVAYDVSIVGASESDESLNHATGTADFTNATILSNGTTMTLTLPLNFSRNGIVIDEANGITADIAIAGTIKATAPASSNVAEESTPVTVTINVAPVNDPPVAVAESYYTRQATPMTITANPAQSTEELVSAQSTWKYRYDGVNYGTAWKEWAFNDSAWSSGPALLGYDDTGITTTIRPVGSPNHATAYFRKEFNITNISNTRSGVKMYIKRDDAAAVYLNGTQIYRDSTLPAAADFDDYTGVTIPPADEDIFVEVNVSRSLLFEGKNVLAVEVHQSSSASSDLRFDCRFTREVGAPGLLANDTDIDTAPASLTAALREQPANGTVTINPNGSFTYTPAPGFIGTDSFAYAVDDGFGDAPAQIIFARGGIWKYLADGTDQGTAWRAPDFVDTAWLSGAAELGYGDGDEPTNIRPDPATQPIHATYYFRTKFTYSGDLAFLEVLNGRILRDDAAAVYLNGTLVYRDSWLPLNAPFDFYTTTGTPSETTFAEFAIASNLLVAGENTIAVEVHQSGSTSSDVSFDFEISGSFVTGIRSTVTVLDDDADNDNVSDTWERLYNFNYLLATDATQDADGDGTTNRAEFLGGSDPRAVGSYLRAQSVTRAGSDVSLLFGGVSPTRTYRLEISDALGGWTFTGPVITPTGASVTVLVPYDAAVPRQFYRLRSLFQYP